MSELTTLARPYAEAVFKRALESGRLAAWSETLAFLAAVVTDEGIARLVADPNLNRSDLIRILLEIGKGRLDREGENLVRLLVQNSRIALVPLIRDLYERQRAEHQGVTDVAVCSAYPLDGKDRDRLVKVLEKNLGRKVRLSVTEDRGLIGGVVIRTGDRVIDASVRGQLERMAKRLYS